VAHDPASGGHRLSATSVRVVELAPPAVNTDLGGVGLHRNGVPLDVFADAVWARDLAGELEIGHPFSEIGRLARRARRDVREPLPVGALEPPLHLGLAPLLTPDTRVVILGSLPGAASLAAEPTIPVTHVGHARRQQEYSGRNIRGGE
jgi:hypothetical protein